MRSLSNTAAFLQNALERWYKERLMCVEMDFKCKGCAFNSLKPIASASKDQIADTFVPQIHQGAES